MKEKNHNTQVNNKKGRKLNKKVVAIGTTAIVALAAILAIFMLNKKDNNLANVSPEIARSMTYDQVQEGEENVEGTNEHVKFDAFFLRDLNGDGYAESIRGTCNEIGEESTLYMELNVLTEGYLENGKITINSDNFYLQTALPKDDELKDNYVGNNIKEIYFNQLNNGTQKLLTGIVRSGDYTYDTRISDAIGNNINNYSKVNSVTLTGTYVDGTGKRIEINKTVEFNVDWHATTKAEMPSYIAGSRNLSQEKDINEAIDEEAGTFTVEFRVGIQEANNQLLLKKAYIEGEIPEFQGYAPTSVEIIGTNVTYTYDAETRKFTAQREAVVDENGNITIQAYEGTYYEYRYNRFNIKVTYPLEAYEAVGSETVDYRVPIRGYYEGYNNQAEEFTNPYKSNIASGTFVITIKNPDGEVARFDVYVGDYISEPTWRYIVSKGKPLKIYNEISPEENNDTYQVRWYAYTGTVGESSGLVMKETRDKNTQVTDNFIKTDSSKESMENVTTNIGISFSGADNILNDDGWIKVYDDETGDLIATFTKDNWNNYTNNNPYKYDLPVKHIRVETSATNANSYLYVYNIKELDDDYITTNYTRKEFDNLQYIESTLSGYLGGTYINTDTHQAHYEAPYSIAEINISNNTISTQVTEKNIKITIQTETNEIYNQEQWKNGIFLIKLPQEMLSVNINNVEIDNSRVNLESYELIEQEEGKFIKIVTSNNNPTTFNITLDVDLTPDPRITTMTRSIELYATNENASDYYYKAQDIYDVNNNLNTTEQVNHTTTSVSMVAPNSLLTNQTASEYDDKGSVVISPQVADIKPVYAVVDHEQEEKTVKIGVQIKNNYASTISEIQIIGKIPFEGNTYVLSGNDLGSTFTTKMVNTGIEVPQELLSVATVYYSTNENPDRDLTKAENNWKTADQVENWDEIKTFIIDLGDYVMPTGKEYVFYYTVKIPNGLEFNQVAFSHHGVYFSLDTEDGKYRTQTEPNKLGFRIAEKYNLELSKFQTGKNKLVPGAIYSVQEIITDEDGTETRGEAKTGVTNARGQLTITNLYAERTYEIREIKTPDDYELNSNVIRFIGHVDDEGTLTIEKTGETKQDPEVIKEDGEDYRVAVQVEDEVKASLKIHKKEQGTNTPIQNVKYKLTGYGLSENGRILTTNINGELTIRGLFVNQEYILQETKADGYYLASPITFKIVNDNGSYKLEIISGTVKNQTIAEEDNIPTASIDLEDEKIPTYNLQIVKIKKTTNTTVSDSQSTAQPGTDTQVTYLEGAKFKLYKGTEEIGAYTTDSTGTVTIDNLYQYIDGKDEDGTYTLKEVLAPDGYAKVKDITFKVQNTDGTLQFINTDGTEENYTVDGTTVRLTIEDSPSFRLIKKDQETQAPIANVKFAIYNVEDGEIPATNSKGEILGTLETINGRDYYTVSTDQNGELTADLTEGLYKAVEVETPDQYDISNNFYYFGIGASREGPKDMLPVWAESLEGSILSVAETSDGGYIAGGSFSSSSITVGDYTLTNTGISNGMLIKYGSEGGVEWATTTGGSTQNCILSVSATSDGGYIAGGYFYITSITVGDYTLTNAGNYDGMVIKYGADGEVEWARSIGGASLEHINSVAETSDGGYIVGGHFYSDSITVGDYKLTNAGSTSYYDGMVIKYGADGSVQWATSIGGVYDDEITSVAATSDGGIVVGGYFKSTTIQVGNYTLRNNSTYYDGMVIKYGAEGKIEWAKSIGGSNSDLITSVSATSDGGIVVGGHFDSSAIQVGNYTLRNNNTYNDGLIIKYSGNGEVEWADSFGAYNDDEINSVAGTSDGGVIAGGYFFGTIQVGNETLKSNGNYDGLIIKYSSSGEVEWVKSFGGSSKDEINSIAEASDGGVIAGGYFDSSTIQVGNETFTSNGHRYGLIIKYKNQELPNPIVTNLELVDIGDDNNWSNLVNDAISNVEENNYKIVSVIDTSDGGKVSGGYFKGTIQIGYETLTSNGGLDALIIKYNAEGKVEWAKSFGGNSDDGILSISETSDGKILAEGFFGDTFEVDGKSLESKEKINGMAVEVVNEVGVPEVQELTVENSRKVFNITTDVNEIDGVKGGSISGEDLNSYEKVKYGDNSTKEIIMTPEEGYEIIAITVNGEEYQFTENEDGTYTMPQFTNVTEDKHIVVTYSKKDNKIVINKVDEETREPIEGVTFKLDQIEERTEPEGVIGTLTDNGAEYIEADIDKGEVTGVIQGPYRMAQYYFEQNDDGTLVPTNGRTYQMENGGSAGIVNTTANSMFVIPPLSAGKNYVVVVNASVSSESNYDFGYATVNESTSVPAYNNTNGRFMYISGTVGATDYTSGILQGGQIYYLHLGYRKDSSGDKNDDQVVINSIKVYETSVSTYNFVDNGKGGYESTNQGQASTTANSYIPIDLTGLTGKYNLTVNANISSDSNDYGYATVTSTTTAPSYSSSTGRFIYISGTTGTASEPTDYTTVLQGGQKYYLHFGYRKDASIDSGDDKFTVNSIEVTPNDSELYHTEVTTNSEGQAITQIPFGKYQVTEVNTPEGYESIEPITINFKDEDKSVAENNNSIQVTVNENGEFTIENKQLQRVIVHHYLKEEDGTLTTIKVAEDEILIGKSGEKYETKPHLDLEKYELEKDESGNYVIPEEANGIYDDLSTDQEVIYYYETKDYPLIVHHYIEGTTTPVPLKDGSVAQDITSTGKEGDPYTTNAIEDSLLDERYELVETPENATGNYIAGETIVTYYYKEVQRPLTINKTGQDGAPLSGVTFEIQTTDKTVGTYVTDAQGKINVNLDAGEYIITETEVPEGYKLPDNPTQTINITKGQESYELNIQNEKIPAQVIVHHYIEGTTDKVPAQNGGVVADEIKTGIVGDMYVSKASNNIAPNYEYVSSTSNTSGTMTEDPIEVIYYYRIKDAGIENEISKTGTDKITSEDQLVEYTITYTGKVTDYIGKATVSIVDTLPYEIDEARSSLNGGLYNDAENTITWTIDVEDIDTYINAESGNISITKQISLAYENMDYSKTSFENKVQGNIYLEETEQEEPTNEDTVVTETEFTTNVTVTKKWNHTNNIYTKPTQVEVQVKNGTDVVERQIINSSNKVGEDENTWSYTFTNLPKYDENGELIIYTVDEAEVNSGDLAYYDKQIAENTITNTYVGPIISAVKESTTADEDRGYVLEGETITYSITITNDGGRDKVVTIQDSAPEGTTFKAGSIKVNGSGADNYTEANLNSGIQVNVPAKVGETSGTTTVSFEVTVNQLEGEDLEALTKTIRNTAVVDGQDTNQVIDIVNKSDVKFNKTSNPEEGSEQSPTKVTAGNKITYTINLANNGTAPETTVVKDSAPVGTTFAGNIVVKVNGVAVEDTDYDEADLRDGIPVTVPPKEGDTAGTVSVSFDVTVNNIDNNTEIINQATVGDGEEPNTNEVKHLYVEPIISQEKTSEILDADGIPVVGRDYALEGETIKYTITVTNNGGLATNAVIKDSQPEGTTFVDRSIEVVNAKEEKDYTQADLNNGIEVVVPEKVGTQVGTASISFEVRVNTLEGVFTKVIENTATVDENPTDEVEVTVNKPNVIARKESTPANGEKVIAGQEITYRIVLDNTQGTAPGTVKVQDTIPTGTTYKENSIMLDDKPIGNDDTDLANGLNVTVSAGEQSILSFTVTVNDLNDGDTITNVAKVDDTPIEEKIIHTYIEPVIDAEKSFTTENKLGYVVEGEKITYTITVTNNGGLATNAVIKDSQPEGTTFVDGSIVVKVNGTEVDTDKTYTEDELKAGITVNVPAKTDDGSGTASVSFEVTVDELPADTYEETIRNTATVNEEDTNEVTTNVNKANIKYDKISSPVSGETVEAGNEITYIITVRNDGTAPDTAIVKDTIPEGTTFVEGSIVVEDSQETYELVDLTTNGIAVPLNPDESKTVEFKVKVQDLDNGTKIRNVATVDDEPTNNTEHTYVEPIISGEKEISTENGLDYVVEGETITYTITVTNDGDAEGTIKVSDQIPEGTTFVPESITVGEEERTELTQENLQAGIDVTVPARGATEVTFQVRINDLPDGIYEDTIENTAIIDETPTNKITVEVHKPNITATKDSEPASGKEVTAGDEITYKINLNNQGTAPGEVVVKDTIPEGTTFVTGSIKVDGQEKANLTADDLANGITVQLDADESKTVEFKVTVNDLDNGATIRNISSTTNPETSEETSTNEVTHKYVEPIIEQEKSATTEKGLDYVGEGETITYTVKVTNTGDLGKKVTVSDQIPEGTTFVDGSIVVRENGVQINTDKVYTESELENGISVNVPARTNVDQAGTVTVTFQVTVNDLPDGTYQSTIRNIATVDGNNTNELTEDVKKAHVRIGKTSEPASGEKVTANDEIRYIIVLENTEGTAPITLQVKDSIPEGTSFIEGSIKVKDLEREYSLEDLTTNGIEVTVPAGQTRTVEFKVKVNDLDNGYIIRNKASIRNPETEETKETNEVTHEYVEAEIQAVKEMTTEGGLSYVIPGEKITYTIRIKNTGDLSKKVTVTDSIPEGTEFVEGSVLLNGTQSNVTKEQLETGIEVTAAENREQTISFTVAVLEGATEIKNTATVDGTPTNDTKVPVLSYEKTSEVIRQTEEEIPEGTVTAGDKIKYTIKVNNLGEEPVKDVTIKDIVPEGTTLSRTSIGAIVNDKNEITWTIDSIDVGEAKEVSFEVIVNYDVVDNKVITNVATVDDENTNEVETPYEKPEIKEESSIVKTGTEKISSTEDEITYKITYNASIKDFVGEGKVTLVDYLPYEIDVENQYLDGGFYDAKTKTITWEQDLGAIDTYTNGDKTVILEKEITVKYVYGEAGETLEGTIQNRVEGTLQLTQKDPEKPAQDKVVLEDKKEATHETEVQIPTYIIVHHYIEGTTTKVPSKVYGEVVGDETQEGYVGQEYTTSASNNVQENYQVVSNSGNTTGTMTRTPIEVIYYYRLQPANITENTITKDGTDKIINKDDKVSYTLTYTGRVENYVGNVKVEIIDYLPFAIDETSSNLNGGVYDPLTKTIRWEEDLGRVNTFAEGPKDISITKNIEVVFTEMNYTGESFINRAQGKIILEETKQEQETPEAEKVTETEFIKDITVEKVWDDNEDIKGRRPDSVTVQLTANGNTIYNNQELEKVVLSDENNWTHTFENLPKYTEQGQEINYSVVETETNKGDLEYYEEPNIQVFNTDTTATVRVTNSYKLMDTNLDAQIEKTGTELITSSSQEVNYNIKYDAKVKDYIGEALVTITDYMPYAIDVEKSELDGGTYDSLSNTITWTQKINHINTYTDEDYQVSINKDIKVVFTNLDTTAKSMVNRVTGRIDLYENETTNTQETTYETQIEIPGNVIVKYVDKESGNEIAEGYELTGLAGDSYRTEQKNIYGYTYVENTNNTSGNMIEGTIEVIYYYERTNAGGVIVHYQDEEGNKLADDVTINGKVQDPYRTEQKDIPNYDFVRVEGQTQGELTEGVIEVTYIYKKIPAKVIVQYLEKDDTPDDNTDNVVLAAEETIEGFSGDTYNTERKEIENYKPADPEPENAEGTMTREDIYVTYYYERKPSGTVTVKYVDVDTNEEILHKVETEKGEEYVPYREQMSGLCGLEYTTEQKDIPYYNFVEDLRPTNAKGIYTEEDIEVIYYYRKQEFNLSVNKQIERITVNGVEHSLKEDLNQIDVVASKVQETDIVVTYKIVVSNPGEIEGTAKVIESIPDFFRIADGTSTEWEENGKSLEAQVTLQPGETKELTVVLRWIRNSNNFGLQINTVTLTDITNPANYEETNLGDNTSTAEVIFSVKTGGIDTAIIIGTALIVMVGALMITIYLKERKAK